jgi:hypothetical protein
MTYYSFATDFHLKHVPQTMPSKNIVLIDYDEDDQASITPLQNPIQLQP